MKLYILALVFVFGVRCKADESAIMLATLTTPETNSTTPKTTPTTPKTTTTTPETTTTTPETTTTTPETTTTTPETTTTTPETTPTAPKTTPTTPKTTTTTPETTTTTPETTTTTPETTPTAPKTTPTTPKTTPTPQPALQNFSCELNNTDKFRALGTFSLIITYTTTGNKDRIIEVPVPHVENDNVTSVCNDSTDESLLIKFYDGWSVEYIFKSDVAGKDFKYHISNITVTYVHDHRLENSTHPNLPVQAHYSSNSYLEASSKGYYSCKTKLTLPIDSNVTLVTQDFKYKAFNAEGNITFNSGSVSECKQDDESSSIVPIAVGAALAGLVVIVLIAYLIGRRRSRKAGYESV